MPTDPKTTPSVTIGFVMRDRFSCSAAMLTRLYEHTHVPFNLIVVDCNMPAVYHAQVDDVLRDRPRTRVIRLDHFVFANAARNLVVRQSQTDYLCLLENDNVVHAGWLSHMLDTAARYPNGGLVLPLLFIGAPADGDVHFDRELDAIEVREENGQRRYRITGARPRLRRPDLHEPVELSGAECHVMLGSRQTFARLGPLDEQINTQDCLDLTLTLAEAGVPSILEPRAHVSTWCRDWLQPGDIDFWLFNRDLRKVVEINRYVLAKWNVSKRSSLEFRQKQHCQVDAEVHALTQAGRLPGYYFNVLRRRAGCALVRDAGTPWIRRADGARVGCNAPAAHLWEMLEPARPFYHLVLSLKKAFPQAADRMVRDCREVVDRFIDLGLLEVGPAPDD